MNQRTQVKVKVTQIRSSIGCPARQKATLRALGLRHRMHSVEKEITPAILGMLRQVSHLVKVEVVS